MKITKFNNNHIIFQNIFKKGKNTKANWLSGIGPVNWSLCSFNGPVRFYVLLPYLDE